MKYEGLWEIISVQGMDMTTFERIWITNEELKDASDENPYKMMYNTKLDFSADGYVKMLTDITARVKDAPEEELKEFFESGEGMRVGDKVMMARKLEWKEKDGQILVDSGERGEVFGEPIDPFRPVVECGNTIILQDTYQFVREGETPSEVKKTVKVVKEGTPEMKEAAGTYVGQYTYFVGSPDSKETSEPFKLVLNGDGTGTSFRNDLEIKVPDWSVENGEFKLTEKFLGTIDYTGKLEGKDLKLFNGNPEDNFTCVYVFVKE